MTLALELLRDALQLDPQLAALAHQGMAFDTGLIPRNATAEIAIVDTAISGTVIPYYCAIHGSTMTQGTITIQ